MEEDGDFEDMEDVFDDIEVVFEVLVLSWEMRGKGSWNPWDREEEARARSKVRW